MARYLADTDWVIEYLNKNPQVRDRLDAYRREGVCVSAISVGELVEGAHGATNPNQGIDRLRDFLAGVESILPVVTETAECFGRERHRLRRWGSPSETWTSSSLPPAFSTTSRCSPTTADTSKWSRGCTLYPCRGSAPPSSFGAGSGDPNPLIYLPRGTGRCVRRAKSALSSG